MLVRVYYDKGEGIESRAIAAELFPLSGKSSSLQLENRTPRCFCCSSFCVSPLLGRPSVILYTRVCVCVLPAAVLLGLGLACHYKSKMLSLTISPWGVLLRIEP
eukprot:369392_1